MLKLPNKRLVQAMEGYVLRIALLTSCWFILESILFPDGFLKKFYLGFYIHPLLLFLCQIFLWIKLLQRWLPLLVSLAIRIAWFVASEICRVFPSILCAFAFIRITNEEFANEVEEHEIPSATIQNQMVDSYSSCYAVSIKNEVKVEEVEADIDCSDSSLLVESIIREPHVLIDEDRSLEVCMPSESSSISPPQDDEINATLPSLCSSNAPTVEGELINQSMEADVDSIYEKYTERMRWFDLLNHDRTCGISAILNKQLASLSSFEDIKPVEFSIPKISWSKMARRRLIRSLESDFELVYVAHSCLSWEVLHYQYRKVEALLCSNFQNGTFYENVVGGFQKFQILLERFMEDERCEGERYWNYAQRRLTFRSLLQVPQVSGYTEEREDDETKGEAMRATEVLQGIEKCIKAFWIYVKTDQKKPRWKMSNLMWTYPPVEDPRDLELLANLTKALRKKELWLKDLQGKRRCWLKRGVNPLEASLEKEILFTMIEMKLVSRVLKMSIISTSQLKWCQEKLNDVKFEAGKVTRANTVSLFPSS
ncbi:hypothetical protein RHSIM_Rhsim10G0032700 [Rhododendron simsii]|uniref:Uncharacterized protein n=1 Tax=Rhododendron simsii TaxID=118357 RepID=A0A834GE92_RHOSS|nr:hypothetical protein RHSIM_Rhsim10G0032700 [Rhododendron simsii]